VSHPAAWHPDPTGEHDHRWWDGERWTEHVADAGRAAVDPMERDAPPPADGAGASTGDQGAAGGEAAGGGLAGASAGGWAQGSDQGRDPDAGGGLADGGEQADQGWQSPEPTGQAWQQGGRPGQEGQQGQGWQQGQDWQGAEQGSQGWQQQGQGWQGDQQAGQAPVWGQSGDAGAWQAGGGSQRTDGVAIAALVVGILAILMSWIPVLGAIVGVTALVLGLVGRSRINKSGAGGKGMAVTGIATGAVAIVINLAILAFLVVAGEDFFEEFGSYVECVEETGDEEFCQQQLEEGLFDRFGP
jgi:hypothetical protein